MYDAVIVEVCDCGESRSNQVGGVGLVVVALSTNAIEQLASEGKVCYKVDCKQG